MANDTPITEASPLYLRVIATCYIIFFIIGISASIYVYQRFANSVVAQDGCSESLKVFIFTAPVVQAVMALALTIHAIFWKAAIRGAARQEALYRGTKSYVRNVNSILAYKLGALGVLFGGIFLLGLTIYRCVLVATNGICA
jgi:hypothetical protein